ncbi:redoxin family protein [Sunxiuqinia rutila]|uniref:redoxin family protein n=1 Tax=Sunxiuqinia rutila TaxID=1397841 RepID=UPI003D363ADC
MKKIQILVLLVITLTACNTKKENVIIKGTVINKEDIELLYSATFNETFNNWFKDSVTIDSSGQFIISLKINKPQMVSLLSESNYKLLIIEPGNDYEIEIGNKKEPIKLIHKTEAQLYYEKLPQTHPNAGVGFFPNNLTNYDSIYNKLIELRDKELIHLKERNVSMDVYNLIRADRHVYYNIAISSLASRINITSFRNNETTPKEVMLMWGNAVADTLLTNPLNKQANYFYELLDMAFWYNLYTKLDYDSISVIRKEKREQGLIHSYNIELAERLLPKEILEYYSATYIQSQAAQKIFEKELINLSEQFKTDFPNSKYISYIRPSIDKIANFYLKVAAASKEEYKFVDNYKNLNSLSDCFMQLKGKKIYVDIWSTSCAPCKEEFEYNEKLKETLNNKGVDILYISLDGDQNQDRWKDMIKYYNLRGNHIRANQKLKTDLREKLGSFGIPRYLIIDEQGNIINRDAPRPSNLKKLEKQL